MELIEQPQEFEKHFAESELPIILDFYTDTCNPCKTLMPILDKLSFEYKNK
ncbi:MAG: thioredoxin family protein, partial [Flavobacteriales bacterium]